MSSVTEEMQQEQQKEKDESDKKIDHIFKVINEAIHNILQIIDERLKKLEEK